MIVEPHANDAKASRLRKGMQLSARGLGIGLVSFLLDIISYNGIIWRVASYIAFAIYLWGFGIVVVEFLCQFSSKRR